MIAATEEAHNSAASDKMEHCLRLLLSKLRRERLTGKVTIEFETKQGGIMSVPRITLPMTMLD